MESKAYGGVDMEFPSDLETGSLLSLDFNPKFESLKQKEVGIALQWSNIKYAVGAKQILNGVSGICEPGNVLALMGKLLLCIKQNLYIVFFSFSFVKRTIWKWKNYPHEHAERKDCGGEEK